MPELPEVETTLRGIAPHVAGRRIERVVLRDARLRYGVDSELVLALANQVVEHVERRAKYLLLRTRRGTVILHLGMSGSLRVVPAALPPEKHDHIDFVLADGQCLRLRDPRRFGSVLWTTQDPAQHRLLRDLGPEPLSDLFSGAYLLRRARGRKSPIKTFIMDNSVVVGVGNIYASEALHRAGIHPLRLAGRISAARYVALAVAIREVLQQAIESGGTTLRDFVHGEGKSGYFSQQLRVYGRAGEPCLACGVAIKSQRIGQRATYFCGGCQR